MNEELNSLKNHEETTKFGAVSEESEYERQAR